MRRGMVRRNQGRDKSFPVQYALVGAKVTASFLPHGPCLDFPITKEARGRRPLPADPVLHLQTRDLLEVPQICGQ